MWWDYPRYVIKFIRYFLYFVKSSVYIHVYVMGSVYTFYMPALDKDFDEKEGHEVL